MKKFVSLLLALVLVCALLPMTAAAACWTDYTEIVQVGEDQWTAVRPDGTVDYYTNAEIDKMYQEYLAYLAGIEDGSIHDPNKHTLYWGYNTAFHWLECACGVRFGVERHVDPLDTTDDTCSCGYHFSDNADLVTLWVDGCPPIKGFDKNQTEYELTAYTYKDVKQIKIATRTFDSEAKVELPEDLTLKTGKNTFVVKVISENKKVTKTYTLSITKK